MILDKNQLCSGTPVAAKGLSFGKAKNFAKAHSKGKATLVREDETITPLVLRHGEHR